MTAIFTESEYEIELSAVQGPAGAGLSAIPNNTLLGNTSGSTATPIARTAAQMGLQPYSANLDQLAVAGVALTTKPTEPGVIWFELPGRYLRMTAPWLFNAGAWDDTGAWYDSQEWAD